MPMPTVSVRFVRAIESEDAMTGAHPERKLGGQSGCPDRRWNQAHKKLLIKLHRDQADSMHRIARAAGIRTSTAVAHLLAYALEKLRGDKKKRDYFEKSIR
jgi:hypothetical protein